MFTVVFVRLLITILMTLSAHAVSDRANSLTTKLDALFGDYMRPRWPGVVILANRSEAKIAEFPHRIADWCLFAGE
jgi:hypothetical protein